MSFVATSSPSIDSTPPSTPPPEVAPAMLGALRASSSPAAPSVHTMLARPVVPKTSLSHPINISWVLPTEYLGILAAGAIPEGVDMLDLTNPATEQVLSMHFQHQMALGAHSLGNLAMSSCPGKKVRLTGPVRGRAAINRDLELDFARMRSFGITTLVCCLEDSELDYLGASWPKYSAIAVQQGLHVLRLPMIEGSCPNTLEEVDAVIEVVNGKIRRGENVLTHCRGGVGRAGLFACCWLIHNTFCLSAERAVRYVRIRRSPKAIETMRQAEFVIHYAQHIARRHQRQLQQHMTHAPPPPSAPRPLETMPPSPATFSLSSPTATSATSPLELLHTDYTLSVPPVIDIINLERIIRQRPRPSSPGHISL